MKTKIILPLMAIMLMLTACDKQPAGKRAPKSKAEIEAAMASIPEVLRQSTPDPGDVFTVSRKGEKVTVSWPHDFSMCKGITILRNATGKPDNRDAAARLPRTSKEYVDSVPDARAYWYWVSIGLPDGKMKRIGPLRAPPDSERTGNYGKASDDIQFVAQRNGQFITVAWVLPDIKYKTVKIKRNASPKQNNKRKKSNSMKMILQTVEAQGDYADQPPDAEADYWYWIEAQRMDGSVITKGPVKAAFGIK